MVRNNRQSPLKYMDGWIDLLLFSETAKNKAYLNIILVLKKLPHTRDSFYWFEYLTWWRKTKRAECLPDTVEMHNRHSISIYGIDFIENKIAELYNEYCDDQIKHIKDGTTNITGTSVMGE